MKADNSLNTSAEPESPKGLDKFKLKTKKDLKKPKKESKTSLKSVDSTSTNLSSNATFADRSLAETTVNVSAISTSPSFTKTYDYTEDEHGATKKRKPVGGFTYESNMDKSKESISEIPTSPSKRAQGLAFNYAPGEAKKVAETAAEKRKTFMEKAVSDGIRTPGINYVQSAVHKEESVKKGPPKTTSVDPKIEPPTEVKFTKTVLEKKVNSVSAETTIETEKKKIDPKLGISNKKSKEFDGSKGVLEKAMDKLGSFGKGSKDKIEADTKKEPSDVIENKGLKKKIEVDVTKVEPSDVIENKGLKKKIDVDAVKKESSDVIENKRLNKKTESDTKKELFDFIENEKKSYLDDKPLIIGTAPLIVKTTTKQTMIKDKEGVTQNIEEKVEDLTSGEVTVSTQHNKVI